MSPTPPRVQSLWQNMQSGVVVTGPAARQGDISEYGAALRVALNGEHLSTL